MAARSDIEWTQRVGGLALMPALLTGLGVDPRDALVRAGPSADALGDPSSRIPYAAFGRLLAVSAGAAECPHFGLLVGQVWTLEHLGLVGQLMKHSPTVGDALRTLAVYHRLNSEGGTVYLVEDADVATLGYAVHQPWVDGIEHIYDAVLACACNQIRELLGPHWNPLRVVCGRATPRDDRPYRDVFRTRLQFDGNHSTMHLPKHLLTQPIPGANRTIRHQLEQQVAAATDTDLLVRLHRALRLLLLSGSGSGDHVAQQLWMHRRTLHRRLTAHGTTFQQVLDDVRWDLARQLLGNPNISLTEVALTTGYADASTFVRAFRRWSGTTPIKWREAHASRGRSLATKPSDPGRAPPI